MVMEDREKSVHIKGKFHFARGSGFGFKAFRLVLQGQELYFRVLRGKRRVLGTQRIVNRQILIFGLEWRWLAIFLMCQAILHSIELTWVRSRPNK